MLSQSQIWHAIVGKWATSAQVLSYIDYYIEHEHYAPLSNNSQLEIEHFRRVIDDALVEHGTTALLYEYVEFRLGKYGWAIMED